MRKRYQEEALPGGSVTKRKCHHVLGRLHRERRMVQVDIVGQVEVGAARKVFDLSLTELGPYSLDFTRSGRYMAIAGRAGHLALMEWQKGRLISEVQVGAVCAHLDALRRSGWLLEKQECS